MTDVMNNRLKILLARLEEKKRGSLNPDVSVAANAYYAYEQALMELRFAEARLQHAVRGLEHKDYDSLFEGWSRT